MRFNTALTTVALLGAALPAVYAGQNTPAAGAEQASIDSKGSADAVPQDQPSPAVPAPSRSMMAQAGDSRGAATGASAAVTQRSVDRREQVRAEAVEAVKQHRATLSMDLDLLDGK